MEPYHKNKLHYNKHNHIHNYTINNSFNYTVYFDIAKITLHSKYVCYRIMSNIPSKHLYTQFMIHKQEYTHI